MHFYYLVVLLYFFKLTENFQKLCFMARDITITKGILNLVLKPRFVIKRPYKNN